MANGDGSAPSPDGSGIEVLEELLEVLRSRLEGFREILDVTAPHVSALDESRKAESIIERAGLDPKAEELAKSVFVRPDVVVTRGSGSSEPEPQGRTKQAAVDVSEGEGHAEAEEEKVPGQAAEDEATGEAFVRAINELQEADPAGFRSILGQLARPRVPRGPLLNQSLLTVAIASFEVLLAGLFREHLMRYPDQVNHEEKEFSLSDLIELGSVEEARRLLIDQRTDSFMRRSFEDWSRWAERTVGVDFGAVALNSSRFHEQFQRRHLIVHTGGRVNRLYLERVNLGEDEVPEEGTELVVTAGYLRAALDEIEVVGTSLVCVAMAKWAAKGPELAALKLNQAAYQRMRAEQWPLAARFCQVGRDLEGPAELRWMLTVNSWITEQRAGDPDRCRQEIEEWDVSALEPKFKLAKAALLGDASEVFEHLPEVAKREGEAARELWNWPLLADYVEDARFAEIVGDRHPRDQEDETNA